MKKRILSLVLVIVMMLSIVPITMFSVSAETVTDSQGVKYTLSDDGTYYMVTGYEGEPTEVVISEEYNGLPVKRIGGYAFGSCETLTSITIPDSVKSIGSYAFYWCESLTSITIPNLVTSIDEWTFCGCESLTSVTIPDSVRSIGDNAFGNCESLTSITIPDSVTSIGEGAFIGCSSLESITVVSGNKAYKSSGDCLIEIATNTLIRGCNNSVIPSDGSVTSIGDNAFGNCESLTSITIPNSVTSIGDGAFYWCESLTSITIPDSVTSIGEYAFYSCYSLTSITIPNSVTSIGGCAFDSCTSLTSITIPNSVTSIDYHAFFGCSSLTSITIPDSVKSIGDYAFYRCSGLTSVVIGDSVTSIGDYAFSRCESLTSITVASGNTKYKSSGNCLIETATKMLIVGCKNSVIPSDGSVKSIGDYAFRDCSSLTSITIPSSVTSIGDGAFESCDNLTSITVASGNTKYKSSGNCLIEIATKKLIAGCKNSIIPSDGSVTSIGDDAFSNCYNLTNITIPDSVTSIGDSAFFGCDGLTSITIPDSVTSIGDGAFESCDNLTSITIPDSVTSIGSFAFSNCDSLSDIYFEAKSQGLSVAWDWYYMCDATVHWGYTSEVAADDLENGISQTETNLIKSDYAKEEWDKIQKALNDAKEFKTDGKTVAEIRSEIDALESAILLNPKKAEFGDLNGDEQITSLDYLFVKRACFGTYELSDVELARADINRDKQTNSADYLLVKRIAFGTYIVQ